jgi:hypothetical protein
MIPQVAPIKLTTRESATRRVFKLREINNLYPIPAGHDNELNIDPGKNAAKWSNL